MGRLCTPALLSKQNVTRSKCNSHTHKNVKYKTNLKTGTLLTVLLSPGSNDLPLFISELLAML